MRLYISADIEGVAGVVGWDQTRETGFEYQRAREWMTGEVVAACEAARGEGVEEVVVSDSHGNGQSLLIDTLPDYVRLVRAWPRPLGMMQGIELGSYVGAMLIGHHVGAAAPRGLLAHTMHGGAFWDVRLNGVSASETVFNAALAAHFEVPILLVSGDADYVSHAHEVLGDVVGVTLKEAFGRISAVSVTPQRARVDLAAGVRTALRNARRPDPARLRLKGPIDLEIDFKWHQPAELLAYLKGFERRGAYRILYRAEDMCEASRVLQFLSSYQPIPT